MAGLKKKREEREKKEEGGSESDSVRRDRRHFREREIQRYRERGGNL